MRKLRLVNPLSFAVIITVTACGQPEDVRQQASSDETEVILEGEVTTSEPVCSSSSPILSLGAGEMAYAMSASDGFMISSEDNGTVRIEGGRDNLSSSGNTSSVYLEIGEDIERILAGNRVTIQLLARSIDGSGLEVAYSTNDNGNSGWMASGISSNEEILEFSYLVPESINPGSDFIGFRPLNGSVEFRRLELFCEPR